MYLYLPLCLFKFWCDLSPFKNWDSVNSRELVAIYLYFSQVELEKEEAYFDRLEKKEAIELKKDSITELRVSVVQCKVVCELRFLCGTCI